MPKKPGGGNHQQSYNEENGQYTDEEKNRLIEKDKEALVMVHYFGMSYNDCPFPFPIFNFHDKEYCEIFVKYARRKIKEKHIDPRKSIYFLTFDPKKDKSNFFIELGFSSTKPDELTDEVYYNTDVKSLLFSRYENRCFKCIAKTKIRGKIVTSVWELNKDFSIRLITVLPGGDKIWKK